MKMKSHLKLNRALVAKKSLILFVVVLSAVTVGVCSCKAWRTVTTSATYVQQSDSTKATATITTKTSEEYVGVRKK